MSAAAKDLRYREYSVSGSLAHDLDWELREHQLRHAGETPRKEQDAALPRRQTHRKARTAVVLREKQGVSVVAVAGFAAVIGLALALLMSYIQLTILSEETVRLKTEFAQLQTEHVSLTTEYERMFDLATVKAAAEAAGMTKPSASQICYVDLSGGDTAVVYRQDEEGALSKALAGIHHGFYACLEYFD